MIGSFLQPQPIFSHFCTFDVEMDLGRGKIGLIFFIILGDQGSFFP